MIMYHQVKGGEVNWVREIGVEIGRRNLDA